MDFHTPRSQTFDLSIRRSKLNSKNVNQNLDGLVQCKIGVLKTCDNVPLKSLLVTHHADFHHEDQIVLKGFFVEQD